MIKHSMTFTLLVFLALLTGCQNPSLQQIQYSTELSAYHHVYLNPTNLIVVAEQHDKPVLVALVEQDGAYLPIQVIKLPSVKDSITLLDYSYRDDGLHHVTLNLDGKIQHYHVVRRVRLFTHYYAIEENNQSFFQSNIDPCSFFNNPCPLNHDNQFKDPKFAAYSVISYRIESIDKAKRHRLFESNWITVEDKTHIFHVLALKNHSLYEFKITYENDQDVYLIDEIATDIAFAYYTNSARDRLILNHNGNYIINRQSNELLISDHLSGQFIQHISGYRDDKLIIETTTHYYLFDGSEWIETLEKKSDHIYLKSLIQVIDEDYYFAYYSLCQNVISVQRIKL